MYHMARHIINWDEKKKKETNLCESKKIGIIFQKDLYFDKFLKGLISPFMISITKKKKKKYYLMAKIENHNIEKELLKENEL